MITHLQTWIPAFAGMTKNPVFRLFARTSKVNWFHLQVILPACCHPHDTALYQRLHGRGLEVSHSNVQQLLLQIGKLHSGTRALSSQSLQVIDDSFAGSFDPPGNAISCEDKNQDQEKNSQRNLYRIGHRFISPFLLSQQRWDQFFNHRLFNRGVEDRQAFPGFNQPENRREFVRPSRIIRVCFRGLTQNSLPCGNDSA